MKQLLFLLLFPCLALAQYQGNANQKITLGEQTTADGLVWRGITSDTANLLTNKLDTSVYIVLDTGTRAIWYYSASTTPKWTRLVDSLNNLQGQLSLTSKVTGVLPVANGGTGQTTLALAGINTGSGTLNYLPKYTATGTTLGNSIIFNNGSNVGIGVTPSTWTSGGNNIEIGSAGNIIQAKLGEMAFINNATFNSGWKYSGNGFASYNLQTGGQHQWFTAPSGIAGNPITFTQAMTLNASGNLSIGNTNDAFKLDVNGNGRFTYTSGFPALNVRASDANFALMSILGNQTGDVNWLLMSGYPNAGDFTIRQSDVVNALTIKKTSGNVGIGTESPAVQFHTTGGVRFAGLASITDLRTDASGNLFNGSDFNLKNSIDTINFGLSDVLKLKPVSFNWNDEQRNINEYKSMGFIAQDVMNIIPNAASTMGDGDMQVDYNAIVATLTKAIQEQNALINALEQRILILENK